MNKWKNILVMVIAVVCCGCSSDTKLKAQTTSNMAMNITIDGKTMRVSLVDNEATAALIAALKDAPITYEANDYGGFEKVGALGRSLPTSNEEITTQAGDVILYNGNQIVLFYGSNSWEYTRLGRIEYQSLNELKSFLKAGEGRVSVRLSAANTTDISRMSAEKNNRKIHALNGAALTQMPTRGIYIKNGKKIIR